MTFESIKEKYYLILIVDFILLVMDKRRLLKKQNGIESYIDKGVNEIDTEVPHIVFSSKEDSVLDETIEGKKIQKVVRFPRSFDFDIDRSRYHIRNVILIFAILKLK